MSIEYVCIVGQVGMTEAEQLRGCVDGCATCGAMTEDYLRVDGRLCCPRCAARLWAVERATHAELAAERTKDVRRIVRPEPPPLPPAPGPNVIREGSYADIERVAHGSCPPGCRTVTRRVCDNFCRACQERIDSFKPTPSPFGRKVDCP